MHTSTKNLFKIEGELIPDKINKEYILKNIDKFDLNKVDYNNNNILMHIINYNYDSKLNFSKEEILRILDKFDLNKVDFLKINILQLIIEKNKDQELGFNKEDILNILDKFDLNQQDRFDLNQQDKYGWNILMYIILYNKKNDWKFNQEDILSILDKFDLNQKFYFRKSFYDYIIAQENFIFDDRSLSFLIAKLDIEMTDMNNENILIKELKRGLCFDSEELAQKILNTENKEIINCIYEHIYQIKWKQKELLVFLSKNNLKIKDDITSII